MTDGRVPRQRAWTGEGPRRMVSTVVGSEACGEDCCKRVLSRSAGWRRKAARAPEERPEVKWERCDRRLVVVALVVVVEDGRAEDAVVSGMVITDAGG